MALDIKRLENSAIMILEMSSTIRCAPIREIRCICQEILPELSDFGHKKGTKSLSSCNCFHEFSTNSEFKIKLVSS